MDKIYLTQEEYEEHCNDYDGICLECGEWTYSGVEQDAEEYECEECGEFAVMGCEQALLEGHLSIGEDDEEDPYEDEEEDDEDFEEEDDEDL